MLVLSGTLHLIGPEPVRLPVTGVSFSPLNRMLADIFFIKPPVVSAHV